MNGQTWIWIACWWGICLLVMVLWRLWFNHINMPKFRSSDESNQAGYFEDTTGHVIGSPEPQEDVAYPHIEASGNLGSGPM